MRKVLALIQEVNYSCLKWRSHSAKEDGKTQNIWELYWTDSNIIFWTSNVLEHVHLLSFEVEHPIFGFERMNIKNKQNFTIFIFILHHQKCVDEFDVEEACQTSFEVGAQTFFKPIHIGNNKLWALAVLCLIIKMALVKTFKMTGWLYNIFRISAQKQQN